MVLGAIESDLTAVTGVYFRPHDSAQLPRVASPGSDGIKRVQEVDRAL